MPSSSVIVAVDADEAGAGGFVERDAEFHLRHGVDDGLVEILDGLDEVAVAHDDVAVFGDHQADGFEVHMPSHYKMNRAVTS